MHIALKTGPNLSIYLLAPKSSHPLLDNQIQATPSGKVKIAKRTPPAGFTANLKRRTTNAHGAPTHAPVADSQAQPLGSNNKSVVS